MEKVDGTRNMAGLGTKPHDGPEHESLCRMASMVDFEDYAKPAAVPVHTVLAGGVESGGVVTSLKRALLLLAQALAKICRSGDPCVGLPDWGAGCKQMEII